MKGKAERTDAPPRPLFTGLNLRGKLMIEEGVGGGSSSRNLMMQGVRGVGRPEHCPIATPQQGDRAGGGRLVSRGEASKH